MPAFVGVDTTLANFTAGTLGQCRAVAHGGDGAVMLAPTAGSEFGGTGLPPGWEGVPWSAPGAATVGGGVLTIDGARANTIATFPAGRSLEFVATFTAAPQQHIGFGTDLNSTLWAIFSTGANGTLQARSADANGTNIDTPIPGSWFGAPHRYRIDWSAGQVVYSIDGTVFATHTTNYTAQLRPIASELTPGGASITIDWIDMTPYTSPCIVPVARVRRGRDSSTGRPSIASRRHLPAPA